MKQAPAEDYSMRCSRSMLGAPPFKKTPANQVRQGLVYSNGEEVDTHMEFGHESVSGCGKLKQEERKSAWQRKGQVAREQTLVCLGNGVRVRERTGERERARERERDFESCCGVPPRCFKFALSSLHFATLSSSRTTGP